MKYRIDLLTDYGESWRATIDRDPDATVGTFSVRITATDGSVWEGVLSRALTTFPQGGKVVSVGIADRLPSIWQQQEG